MISALSGLRRCLIRELLQQRECAAGVLTEVADALPLHHRILGKRTRPGRPLAHPPEQLRLLKNAEQDIQLVAELCSNNCFIDAQTAEGTHMLLVRPHRHPLLRSRDSRRSNRQHEQCRSLAAHNQSHFGQHRAPYVRDGGWRFRSLTADSTILQRCGKFGMCKADKIPFHSFETVTFYVEPRQSIRIVME